MFEMLRCMYVTHLYRPVHLLFDIKIKIKSTGEKKCCYIRCCVLSDLKDGKSVGSLILGPDGEIIQLSLYDNSQDSSHDRGDTQEQGTLNESLRNQNLHTSSTGETLKKTKSNYHELTLSVSQLSRFCLQKERSYPGSLCCSLNIHVQVRSATSSGVDFFMG